MAKSVMPRKTVGRRKPPAARKRPPPRIQLGDSDRDLVRRLCDKTGLAPAEVIERALAGYSAAVAPGMPLHPPPPAKGGRKAAAPDRKLFLSVDGRPEVEVTKSEFVLGSAADGVDLRLDLPLISPRHARILWKQGAFVFEDLRSTRGSYRLGQPVDVHPISTGDEIDIGGFLPIRFRLG